MTNIIGKGGTAEVIEYGEVKVCKLFYEGQPEEFVKLEYENAKEMYKNRISVPRALEIISIERRNGIIYEKIYGKSLWKLLKEENGNDELDIFVNLHFELLSHHSKNLFS